MVAVLLTSCGSQSNGNVRLPVLNRVETLLDIIDSENGKPLKEVVQGIPVRLVLEVKNLSDEPVTFTFSSGKQYDFDVHDADNQLVWRWSHDKVFTQAFSELKLGPKEQVKFTPIWDQKDNEGRQVPPGSYRVTGMMTSIGGGGMAEPRSKTILIKNLPESPTQSQ